MAIAEGAFYKLTLRWQWLSTAFVPQETKDTVDAQKRQNTARTDYAQDTAYTAYA